MKVGYHPDVQKDVRRILKRYDEVSDRDLRRANLKRFPYHFLFRVLPDRIRVTAVRHHKQNPQASLQRR